MRVENKTNKKLESETHGHVFLANYLQRAEFDNSPLCIHKSQVTIIYMMRRTNDINPRTQHVLH